jgi:hypothetical protein
MKVLTWNQKLGLPECPYVHRWCLNLGLFTVRVHHFLRSDDNRALHDHPFWFITLVIKGKYDDVTENGYITLTAGDVAFRPALHRHTVRTTGVWTLLLTGHETRVWGFYPNGRFKRREKYFKKYGHHPCDQL